VAHRSDPALLRGVVHPGVPGFLAGKRVVQFELPEHREVREHVLQQRDLADAGGTLPGVSWPRPGSIRTCEVIWINWPLIRPTGSCRLLQETLSDRLGRRITATTRPHTTGLTGICPGRHFPADKLDAPFAGHSLHHHQLAGEARARRLQPVEIHTTCDPTVLVVQPVPHRAVVPARRHIRVDEGTDQTSGDIVDP